MGRPRQVGRHGRVAGDGAAMTKRQIKRIDQSLEDACRALVKAKGEQNPGSMTDRLLDVVLEECRKAGEIIEKEMVREGESK